MIYILVPGAWAGGWVWDAMAAKLRRLGHSVHQLTLPGLADGEEAGWLSSSEEADLVETLRENPNWTFKAIDGGHWPMLTMPEKLAALMHDLRT